MLGTKWIVEHGNDSDSGPYRSPVATVDDLDRLLDRIDTQARDEQFPAAVMISQDGGDGGDGGDGPVLSLGLGRAEFSFLTYNTDHVHSDLDGGQSTEWFINGEPSELPPGFCLPVADAREAAREFFGTGGQRPTNVDWDED